MPNHCKICSDPAHARLASELIAEGRSDQRIATTLGGGISRMSVYRHRLNHLEKPAQALAAAASRGEDRREPLTPGDAAQWLGLP